jgi:hypothetical protein
MAHSRLVAVVAVGVLAVVGLSACRVNTTGKAAFVGDNSYSTDQLDQIVDAAAKDGYRPAQSEDRNAARRWVLSRLVFNAVAERYATERGYSAPDIDYAGAATQYGVPATDPRARLSAEAGAWDQLLLDHADKATPSDTDLREVYQLVTGGNSTTTFAQAKPLLLADDEVKQGIVVRNALRVEMSRYSVDVNPAYGPLVLNIAAFHDGGQAYAAVPLTLGEDNGDTVASNAG